MLVPHLLPPIIRRGTTASRMAGIAVRGARPGETAMLRGRALVTSDDGPHVYGWLDSMIGAEPFGTLLTGIPHESVTSLLINIADSNVTAWVNAAPRMLITTAIRGLLAGEPVSIDDLAQIGEVHLSGVEPEPDKGSVLYAVRIGWRLGLYFDFRTAAESPSPPLQGLRASIGQVHTLLTLRARIRFADVTLKALYERGWFPFVGLPTSSQRLLCQTVDNGWPITEEIEKSIVDAVAPRVQAMVGTWKLKEVYEPHIKRLTDAARYFHQGEFLSAHSLAFPAVEGILRRSYLRRSGGQPDYRALRDAMVRESYRRTVGRSALLPEEFSEYLDVSFLAPFDLAAGNVPPSRHAVAHGVASDEELSKPVHALRVFLTLEQLFFYL